MEFNTFVILSLYLIILLLCFSVEEVQEGTLIRFDIIPFLIATLLVGFYYFKFTQ